MKKILKTAFEALYQKDIISTQFIEEPAKIFANKRSLVRGLKNKYAGKRCFILGNGPSLSRHDLSLLKDEFTFGVNSIFLMTDRNGFKPNFYVVEDGHVINNNLERINEYDAEYTFLPSANRLDFLGNKDAIFLNFNRGFYEPLSPSFECPRFSLRPDKVVYCGQSVTIVNLQLAFYMGFSEVYMIGMDFSYNIPDSATVNGKDVVSDVAGSNHFSDEYMPAGQTWHDPKLDNILKSYEFCRFIYEKNDRKIINASYGGKLEAFPRCNYEDLF